MCFCATGTSDAMRALILSLVALTASAQQSDPTGRFHRTNARCEEGRSSRGFDCGGLPFFALAPPSGAGIGAACACAAITSAQGGAMTLTRAGNATCSPLGLATTGIGDASLVECAGNLPRVERSLGQLGVRVHPTVATNVLTRFIDYANATWTDVATPTLTGSQPSPWTGTHANLGVQISDNDPAAFEGRAQAVTVTAATQYTMSCFVKAGTLAAWTLSLDGTTASGTGLSSTTWSLVSVTDASSSGVSISAQALNGSVVADTGTLVWGGCQVEAGAVSTAMIPTVAAAATRNAETFFSAANVLDPSISSIASTYEARVAPSTTSLVIGINPSTFVSAMVYAGWLGVGVLTAWSPPEISANYIVTQLASARVAGWSDGTNRAACQNGVCGTPAAAGAADPTTGPVRFGQTVDLVLAMPDAIYTNACIDPSPTRCR